MELLNSVVDFFTDRTRGLSSKTITFIFILVFLVFLDNTFSFSYSYNVNNKIEQLSNMKQVLADSTLSQIEKRKLHELRKDIINRETWKDKTSELASNISFKNYSFDFKDNLDIVERSDLWHFVSSSWIILFTMLIFPIIGFLDRKTSFGQAFIIVLVLEPILYGFAWLSAKLFSFIPVIMNKPAINYTLNAILCFLIFLLLSIFSKKIEKQKKAS